MSPQPIRTYAATATSAPNEDSVVPTGRPPTILLVEDQAEVLSLMTDVLRVLGYGVLSASGPEDGLRLNERHSGSIDLLLTDVVMPEMNGPELARRIRAHRPDLQVLYVSGHPADELKRLGVPDSGRAHLRKPFSIDTLGAAVGRALCWPGPTDPSEMPS